MATIDEGLTLFLGLVSRPEDADDETAE